MTVIDARHQYLIESYGTRVLTRKFSENVSTCMEALLCDHVLVPPLDLAALNDSLKEIGGKVDKFMRYREDCCYLWYPPQSCAQR